MSLSSSAHEISVTRGAQTKHARLDARTGGIRQRAAGDVGGAHCFSGWGETKREAIFAANAAAF
jgi:hypothetical protein